MTTQPSARVQRGQSIIGAIMNMTRRDTLAGAIALLCGLAAEAEARSGTSWSGRSLDRFGGPGGLSKDGSSGEEPAPDQVGINSNRRYEMDRPEGWPLQGRSEDRPYKSGTAQAASGEQGGERGDVGLVFKHDLPNLTMDDWEVTVSQVDFAPGRTGKVHHHAGFVLAYVLEGNIVSKVSGQEEKTFKPGEMFFEPPGSTHEVSNNASATQPAKLLALIFAKKGAQLTMPGPA